MMHCWSLPLALCYFAFLYFMLRTLMLLGLFSTLFGCGDGKPGLFSSNGYHINKDKVWCKTSLGMSYNVNEVAGADPQTFAERELSSKMLPGATAFYGFDKNSVFWAVTKIEGADLASFEYVSNNYSKDKRAVYYMSEPLTDDLAHFAVINYDFVKDSKAVYFGRDVFSDDPTHFVEVGHAGSGYYKDSQQCWYGIYELKGVNPALFRYVGPKTATNGQRVFQEMNEVEGAEIATYQILERGYAKDAHHVYQKGVVMAGADPATFRILSDNYTLDKQYCYYFMTPLPNADPATFQLIDEYYTKDARQVFCGEKPIEGADPATFRVLNGAAGCSCDAHYAYTLEKRITGVDPRNFPAKGKCQSCNETEVKF